MDVDGTLNLANLPAFPVLPPVPDSQESIFSFAALDGTCPDATVDEAVDVPVPSSQDAALAQQAQHDLNIHAVAASSTVDGPSIGGVEPAQAQADMIVPHADAPVPSASELVDESREQAIMNEHAQQRSAILAALRSGRLQCPMCSSFATQSAPGLVRHICSMHHGTSLDHASTFCLQTLERGFCVSPGCGALRRFGNRHCSRCHSSADIRTVLVGDIIPAPPSMRFDEESRSDTAAVPIPSSAPMEEDGISLGADFLARVRRLPSSSCLIHTPFSLRLQMCEIMAKSVDEALNGSVTANILEESRSKLIYSMPPKGTSNVSELRIRCGLWTEGHFDQLLERIEQQNFNRSQRRKRKGTTPANRAELARKARSTAAEGAYKKALGVFGDGPINLSAADQVRHATSLLPCSSRPETACANIADDEIRSAPFLGAQSTYGTDDAEHPLRGVRFGPLSAPGPSGARPEHIKEALMAKSRPVTNKLLRSLERLEKAASKGTLPETMGWLRRSRLMYLKKKTGVKLRPIRIGEILRRIISKRSVRTHRSRIQLGVKAHRQGAVAIPRGCEALVHFRDLVERAASTGTIDPLVSVDSDLANCFCTLEWDTMREDLQTIVPEVMPWVSWQQQSPGVVVLPCGDELSIDRGAEQGDPLGSLEAASSLGAASLAAHKSMCGENRELADISPQEHWGIDQWFADDGQLFLKSNHADSFLRKIDGELHKRGAFRETGEYKKSVARLLCPAGSQASSDWCTEYIQASCLTPPTDSPVEVLGAPVGPFGDFSTAMEKVHTKIAELHSNIADIDDPATELVLTRKCADVSRAMYLMRCCGDRLLQQDLEKFDDGLLQAVESCLRGEISENPRMQATCGVRQGGVGLRSAKRIALIAAVASLASARPMVFSMCSDMVRTGLAGEGVLESEFDARLDAAMSALSSTVPAETAETIRSFVAQCQEHAELEWRDLGTDAAISAGGGHSGRRPGHNLVNQMWDADSEMISESATSLDAGHPQRGISHIVDEHCMDALTERFQSNSQPQHVARLRDIRHPNQCHDWLWALGARKQAALPAEEFVVAVRLRLGASVIDDVTTCSYCHDHLIDSSGLCALQCAGSCATRGHTAVKDAVMELAVQADPAAEAEPAGLVAHRPGLRPADVLCAGSSRGQLCALDVGVTMPLPADGDTDAAQRYKDLKLRKYRNYADAMRAQGITYTPIIWTSWGRAHDDVIQHLRSLAARAARRRGLVSHKDILREAQFNIALELQARAARMVLACTRPPEDADDE